MPATPTRDRVKPETNVRPLRRPEWIKVRAPSGETYEWLHGLMRKKELHTVCEEAMCPNLGECWGSGTATFLMLGDVCTRTCAFCDVKHGKPGLLDWGEAERVAQAVKAMELKHAVITSVNRDERRDGGAPIFAMVIRRIRELRPGCSIEVLIPDFKGSVEALKMVMDARPEILNHNVETVPSLYRRIRPGADYRHSLALLRDAKQLDPRLFTKSGIMVGLGETDVEIADLMDDLRAAEVDFLTVGQYLQPTRKHAAIDRFVTPETFQSYKRNAESKGFLLVAASPLTRSSYHAAEDFERLEAARLAALGA